MIRNASIVALLIGILAAAVSFTGPAAAGTCQPVKAKGEGKNVTWATNNAQVNLRRKARALGGKVTQTSMNCVPGPKSVVCKVSAVVCPK